MDQATSEMSHCAKADYLIINDDFDHALQELTAIITAQRLRQNKQRQRHSALIAELLN